MKTRQLPGLLTRALGSVVLALGLAAGLAASSGAAEAVPAQAKPVMKLPTNSSPLAGRGELAPKPGSAAVLQAVFCPSAASCWAVGYFERNGAWLNEILRWNGRRWSRVGAPNPGGTASGDTSDLFGVRCTAARNCWAVGS